MLHSRVPQYKLDFTVVYYASYSLRVTVTSWLLTSHSFNNVLPFLFSITSKSDVKPYLGYLCCLKLYSDIPLVASELVGSYVCNINSTPKPLEETWD